MSAEAYRVLLVEDSATARKMLREALGDLERFEIVVEEVETVEGALAAARNGGYDLIFMDYELPDGDGIQAIDNLRGRGVDDPIVMLTGEGDEEVASQAIRSGADDYLTKENASPQRIAQTTRNQLTIRDLDRQADFVARHRDRDGVPAPETLALLGAFGATIQEGLSIGMADLLSLHARIESHVRDLEDRDLDEVAEEDLAGLRRDVEDLEDTLDRLDHLDVTLRSLRRLTLTGTEPRVVDLDELVGQVVDVVRMTPRTKLETDLDGPDAIEVDPAAIRQILMHLISNAAQASDGDDEPVTLRTRTAGDEAVIEVADRGSGVPEEVRDRVFDLYVTTKEDHEGLGLPLVRTLVRNHGGTITFRDREDGGTVFTVRLPRVGPGSDV